MANAFVEKLKGFGLHHGEKVAVALTGAACVGLLAVAMGKTPIELTPEEVKAKGDSASQNLNKEQDAEEVRRKVQEEGVDFAPGKVNDFLAKVKDQEGHKLASTEFPLKMPFVVQEPGAGVIRENVSLLAVNALRARSGRGGAWVYQIGEDGKRVELTDEDREARAKKAEEERKREEKKAQNRGRNARGGAGSGMMGSGMMPGAGGSGELFGGGNAKANERDRKKQEEQLREQEKQKQAAFAGSRADAKKAQAEAERREAQKKAEAAKASGIEEPEAVADAQLNPSDYIEELQGKRWVVITGLLDNQALRERYARALKLEVSAAYPYYKELGVQRQHKLDNGDWSEWEDVSLDENRKVTDNLPETQQDYSKDDVRLSTLVSSLPYLRVGFWVGSEPIEVIPKEVLEAPKPDFTSNMAYGSMMMGGYGMPGGMGMGSYGGMMPGGGMGSAMMGEGGSYGMMMMGGYSSGSDDSFPPELPKTDAELIMVRFADFTVQPETTYRYRLRLVTYNPNLKRDNVAPGTDTASPEIFGPWSDPTGEVTVPADVALFAMGSAPYSGNPSERSDQVQFQVAAFNPADGVTVLKDFAAGPGQIIGEQTSVRTPDYTGDVVKAKSKQIDFISNKLVVDTLGGVKQMTRLELPGSDRAEIPPVALLLRPDGRVVIRAAAEDRADESRVEMKKSFAKSMEDANSDKAKAPAFGGYEGMMPGMGSGSGRR